MMILGISLLNIISWTVFGLLIGAVINWIDPGDVRGGVFGTLILGILGALLGGFLAKALFNINITAFSVNGFIAAVIGGLILAFLSRLLFRNNEHIKTNIKNLR